ncbi:galactosylceramide sulfotransferase-like [Ptychodera flava]|uniref:galactosylceramide sulfotransferase-like n=1 Tax=Ptychodera flava TaxID=63121 RepID=UPI00396AA136
MIIKRRRTLLAVCSIWLTCIIIYLTKTSSDEWLGIPMPSRLKFSSLRTSLSGISSRMASTLHLTKEDLCVPTKNIVYVKTHKTGSTTLATIFYRYGHDRNLSFLFTFRQPHGHFRQEPLTPYSQPQVYPPVGVPYGEYERYKFNISAGHLIYHNKTVFDYLIAGRPKYITILREPVQQFVSFFSYFHFPERYMKIKADSPEERLEYLEEFLRQPSNYSIHARLGNRSIYIPNRNPQFFDLGLPLQQMDAPSDVTRALSRIEADFDLVLITEYLDESLLLLKKKFCWDMNDILYFKTNVLHANGTKLPENLVQKTKQWNSADVILYEHFNRTLWREIGKYGPTFERDLLDLRKRLEDLNNECIQGQVKNARTLKYVNVLKRNASVLCQDLNRNTHSYFVKITRKQKIPPDANEKLKKGLVPQFCHKNGTTGERL